MSLDATIFHIELVFKEIRPKSQIFLAQIEDKQMPHNAPPIVFKKADTSFVKLQIRFGLGNRKVPRSSIGQKSS